MPVSWTRRVNVYVPVHARQPRKPPLPPGPPRVNLTPLATRCQRICRKRSGSPTTISGRLVSSAGFKRSPFPSRLGSKLTQDALERVSKRELGFLQQYPVGGERRIFERHVQNFEQVLGAQARRRPRIRVDLRSAAFRAADPSSRVSRSMACGSRDSGWRGTAPVLLEVHPFQ